MSVAVLRSLFFVFSLLVVGVWSYRRGRRDEARDYVRALEKWIGGGK